MNVFRMNFVGMKFIEENACIHIMDIYIPFRVEKNIFC